jgi:hypothetical protein
MAQEMIKSFKGLNVTNNRIDMLRADFSGLQNLDEVISSVLNRLSMSGSVKNRVAAVGKGTMSRQEFDGWMAELVRVELGKTLGIVRAKAVQRAQGVGDGSASSAVLRRMYKDMFGGNINIAESKKRISNRKRLYTPGNVRPRHVSERTKQLNEYYGPDRGFILRFLEGGTDVRTAKSYGPTGRGSRASWGRRGSIAPRPFFHQMSSDMEQAAQQLGQTLKGYVETWIEKEFKER